MNKISKYFRGVNEEAKRIRWPDQKKLWKSVGTVLLIAITASLIIVLSDFVASQILKAFDQVWGSSSSSSDSSSTSTAVAMLSYIRSFF